MNRTIKFRGKRIADKEGWVYGWLVKIDNNYIIAVETDINTVGYIVIPETIGMFTGLHDSNGKEIYEGDIISVNGAYPKIIRFIDRFACFCMANISELKDEKWREIWQQPSTGWWQDFKRVIVVEGNEHDYPELLKQEDGK
ncbi:MAG: YopX family protein [Prevotellaceae bacterium]|jgi:uncharacterized phage protein (TIGR01671 family)|nr:YopX family protein [Prevotellaceae bacterium]